MERQLQMFSDASEHYLKVAERVAKFLDESDEISDEDAQPDAQQDDDAKKKKGESRRAHLDRIRKMMLGNIRLERDYQNRCRAMELTKEKLSGVPDLDVEKEYERFLADLSKNSSGTDEEELKKHPSYVKLEDATEDNLKVPENKVQNRICGHLYEKGDILKLIANSKANRIRCPISNCTNKTPLRKDDFVSNAPQNLRRKSTQKKESKNAK